jgi:hypothetical protein
MPPDPLTKRMGERLVQEVRGHRYRRIGGMTEPRQECRRSLHRRRKPLRESDTSFGHDDKATAASSSLTIASCCYAKSSAINTMSVVTATRAATTTTTVKIAAVLRTRWRR